VYSLILGLGFVAICALLPLSIGVLLRGFLARKRSRRRKAIAASKDVTGKNIAGTLVSGAGIGAWLLGALYTLSQLSHWSGQGILGIITLPPVASLGASVGVLFAGVVVLFDQKDHKGQ
jgi:hypothetical protein